MVLRILRIKTNLDLSTFGQSGTYLCTHGKATVFSERGPEV